MRQTLKLTGVGLLALISGAMIYLVVRPEGSSHLSRMVHVAPPVLLEQLPFSNNLPSFFHVVGFSILTIVILGGRKYVLASCSFWLAVNVLFELGQHPYLVQFLDANVVELPRVLDAYFRFGTFDLLDVTASVVGAIVAYYAICFDASRSLKGDDARE